MVLRGAANSVLLVAVTHVMFNRSANSDGIAADILSSGDNQQMAVLLATLVLTVVLGIILRKKLSRSSVGARRAGAKASGHDGSSARGVRVDLSEGEPRRADLGCRTATESRQSDPAVRQRPRRTVLRHCWHLRKPPALWVGAEVEPA
jgi:hypothetical protein